LSVSETFVLHEAYWADDVAQTTTNGLLAGFGTTPQESDLSLRMLAERRLGPQ
jgi:hypothetical protein